MCVFLCVCVFVCVCASGINEPTNQRTNEPTNQRTNEQKKTLLISLFICRGGTPYDTLGFIPQVSSVMLCHFSLVFLQLSDLKFNKKINKILIKDEGPK